MVLVGLWTGRELHHQQDCNPDSGTEQLENDWVNFFLYTTGHDTGR